MSILNQTSKLQQILAILLIIQIALAAFVLWPQPVASQPNQPLLPDFKADQVTELVISDGDENRIALAKKEGSWVLAEAGDYPVKAESVTELLNKLEAVKTNRLVTQTEASHKRLQVAEDDFNRRLEITLANGATHTLYLGSSGGVSATHVRADDQEQVYLSGDIESFDVNTTTSGWIDTIYFTLPATSTTKLTLENSNGVFEFTRQDETWSMAGLAEDEVLDETIVNGLNNQATSFRMEAPVGVEEQASFGLDNPQATITLETAEETYTLLIGAQDAENSSYFAKASNSAYYVRISDFTADSFVAKTREDFIQDPPTPEAEATEEPAGGAETE
jgi:hypothetical protein